MSWNQSGYDKLKQMSNTVWNESKHSKPVGTEQPHCYTCRERSAACESMPYYPNHLACSLYRK